MAADAEMLRDYIAAFNRGDTAAYGACYAADVLLVNGAGDALHGRDAVTAFYAALRGKFDRTITLEAVVAGDDALAAQLHSHFIALEDGLALGGAMLGRGDRFELRSIALYELEHGKFKTIRATTLERRLVGTGED